MNVFVTGASGFVGSAVIKRLAEKGFRVTGLVRKNSKAYMVEDAGASVVVGDLLEAGAWTNSLRDSDLVISTSSPVHYGDRVSFHEARRRSYYHGKMVGNIFLASQDTRVRGVVLTYGALGFGDHGQEWVDENAEISPVGYERSVSGAFWHINKTSRKVRVPLISMFTGWVYGPDDWFAAMARGIMNGTFRVVGDGKNYMSLIHIDDLAEAYAKLAEKVPLGSRYCAVDGNPVTQRRLADFIAKTAGCPAPETESPERYARRAGELAAETFTSSVRVSGEWMKRSLIPELKYPDYKEGIPALIASLGVAEKAEPGIREAAGF